MKANISISLDVVVLQLLNELAKTRKETPSQLCQRALLRLLDGTEKKQGLTKGDEHGKGK
jgi:hypothetical protein